MKQEIFVDYKKRPQMQLKDMQRRKEQKLKKKQIQTVENVIESLMECSPYDEKETEWMIGFFKSKLEILNQ